MFSGRRFLFFLPAPSPLPLTRPISSSLREFQHGAFAIKTDENACTAGYFNTHKEFRKIKSTRKLFLLHYLEPVGGKFILACNFDVNKLPINLPRYYKECLESFSLCSAATQKYDLELTHEEIYNSVIWNNKFICINGKSVFNRHLLDKELIRVGDMVTGTESTRF